MGVSLALNLDLAHTRTLTRAFSRSCALACSITSFYRWGNQWIVIGQHIDRSIISSLTCAGTYADARSDYKAMSAFGFVVATVSIAAGVSEWFNHPENERMADARGVALTSEQDNFM